MDRGVLGWVLALNLVAVAALVQRFGSAQILASVTNQVQQLAASFRPAAALVAGSHAEPSALTVAGMVKDVITTTAGPQLPTTGPYAKGRSCGLLNLHSYVVVSERVELNKYGVKPAAVYVEGGRIARIAEGEDRFKIPEGMYVINMTGAVLSPGVIDVHVHLNEPGREEWEGITTGTAAAAAGGVTMVVDMPLNSYPTTTTPKLLRAKQEVTKAKAHVNTAHWAGLVPENAGNHALLKEMLDAGALGFKAFMSPSGINDFAPVSIADIRKALPLLKQEGAVLYIHAELVSPVELPNDADPTAYSTFLWNRPAEFEQKAIIELVKMLDEDKAEHKWGFSIHIAHLSDASSLPLLKNARFRHPITVETCAHYLKFSAESIPDRATLFACMPPIRDAANQAALVEGLKKGDITIIASDHSPAPAAMKMLDDGNFLKAWGGISSLQYLLPAAWTSLYPHGLDTHRLAVWLSGAPSRLAGISNRKGQITVGFDADLVLWDPTALADTSKAGNHHRHKESPYNDVPMYGKVLATIVNGDVVYMEGRLSESPCGRLVLRGGVQHDRLA